MEDFHNEVVSFDTLPKFESVAFTPLHRDYLNVIYIINAIIALVFSIAVGFFLVFIDKSGLFFFPLIGGLIVFVVLLFWLGNIGFKKRGYALREKDIFYRKGIIATTTTIIPFNRIQHVALHEGVLDRMYDLSELQIYTAGGSNSDLSIVGLPKELAEQIKTFLLNKILIENELDKSFESNTLLQNEPIENDIKLDSESEKGEVGNGF